MQDQILGLIIGGVFGAGLFLSGLANPDKIIGALRLRDFHAIRVIAVFILVSMLGVWLLDIIGVANFSVKPAVLVPVIIGGGLLGIGFGLTGYCPGTGLVCAAAGRIDALVSVVGMLLGALLFILIHPLVVPAMESVADYGKTTLPEYTHTNPAIWVWPIVVVGGGLLYLTRPRRKPAAAPAAPPAAEWAPPEPAPAPAPAAPAPPAEEAAEEPWPEAPAEEAEEAPEAPEEVEERRDWLEEPEAPGGEAPPAGEEPGEPREGEETGEPREGEGASDEEPPDERRDEPRPPGIG
jgi:hypothetical protein